MNFSLAQILALIIVYLGVLFLVALSTDRGLVPERLTRHPAVYVLSLGVFTWALATGDAYSIPRRPSVPWIFKGAVPSCASIRAPMASRGVRIRRIGRLFSDASPVKVTAIGEVATNPMIKRTPVPEFPQSIT